MPKSGKKQEIFKTKLCHPLLKDLKWINFNIILLLNEASLMYKNLHVSTKSNKKHLPPKQGTVHKEQLETALMYILIIEERI